MKHTKILLSVGLLLLSAVSFIWLIAHVMLKFPWHGLYHMTDPDSLLFARILEQSILKEKILLSDNYGCFPYEILHGFAPFYMYFLYIFVSFFYAIFPNCGFDPIMVAGCLPIFFTWLTGVMISLSVWFLSKNIVLTLITSLFMLPGYSAFMNNGLLKLDYDFMISFFIWAWLLLCTSFNNYKNNVLVLLGGLVTALFIGVWSGNPLFFFFVTVYGLILWLTKRPDSFSYNEFASSAMLIGALLNILYIFKNGNISDPLSINKYSYFQPLCCLAGGFFLYFLNSLQKFKNQKILGLSLFGLFGLILVCSFYDQIMQALGFVLQKDPIHITISELRSVYDFSSILQNGKLAAILVEHFSWTIIFLPIFVFTKPKGFKAESGAFLRDWLLLMIFMSAFQLRYFRWPGIGLGLYSGMIAYGIWLCLKTYIKSEKYKQLKTVLIFLPLILLFLSQNYFIISKSSFVEPHKMEALGWIYRNTPPTSGYADDEKPEYGILAYWDDGNYINYYAKRPSIVNNAMWGYRTMAHVFSALNEHEAYALCEEYKIRYIFIDPSRNFSPETYGYWPYFKDLPKKPEYKLLSEKVDYVKDYENYFFFWLKENLALAPRAQFAAASHFRLVYVGNTEKKHVFPYALFEKVKGAVLNVEADKNTEVSVSLNIYLDGNEFLHKTKLTTDENGRATFVLPYANSHMGGRVKTDSIYKISCTQNGLTVRAKVVVKEPDVINGLEVEPEPA